MQKLAIFDFNIEYKESKKNPTDRLFRRPNYQDSSEAATARRALLASFLDRFVNRKAVKESNRAVKTVKVLYISFQKQLYILQKEKKTRLAGKLIHRLSFAKAVKLIQVIGYSSLVAS